MRIAVAVGSAVAASLVRPLQAPSPPPLLLPLLLPAASAGQQQAENLQFTAEQLGQLVGLNLQAEEKRSNETLFRFYEFQSIQDLDCHSRLLLLFNLTLTLRDGLESYHNDVLGVSGLYVELLRQVPDENTWIWLLTGAQERVVQRLNSFWARVVAIALDQHQCVFKEVKDVLLDAVVRWKKLNADFVELQWNAFAFGRWGNAQTADENLVAGNSWISGVREWFEGFLASLYQALQVIQAQGIASIEGGATRLHHQDEHGSFVTYEFLRRKAFRQWAIDRGLMRGLLRHVWQPPVGHAAPLSLGDFGAGGGHYSTWLNETGLLQAFAFDGTHQAAELTGGAVQEVNLVKDMELWRTFEWVMCLEVGEHVPAPFSDTLMSNLKRHARKGLIMSWSDDWEGIGHVNCKSRDEFVAYVQAQTGFVLDKAATEKVKATCEIDYIARTIAVFRNPSASS